MPGGEKHGTPKVLLVMLFGPALQAFLYLVDFVLRPIPLTIYVPISMLVAAVAIVPLLYLDFQKRLGEISRKLEPHYHPGIRAGAWGVLFLLVFVTVELGLFKYKNSFGDVLLVDECVSSIENPRRGMALRKVIAQSPTSVTLVCTATIHEWARPQTKIDRIRVVKLHKEEIPIKWNLGEGDLEYHAPVEVYETHPPKRFNIEVVVASSESRIADPCSVLEFSFATQPLVSVVESDKWFKYNPVKLLWWIALLIAVSRATYILFKHRRQLRH